MKYVILSFFILGHFIVRSQKNHELISNHLSKTYVEDSGFGFIITDESYSRLSEVHHVYLNQSVNGIEIYNSGGNFAIQNEKILFSNFTLIKNASSRINSSEYQITPEEAIDLACAELGIIKDTKTKRIRKENDETYLFDKGSFSEENIPVQLMYYHSTEEEEIHLVWDLSIYERSQNHWWSVRVDAMNGELIDKIDWVIECTFNEGNSESHTHIHGTLDCQAHSSLPPSVGAYNVFALPVESPSHGNRSIVSGTLNPAASPFGWHDINGASGAEYTNTRGNNVYAYEDQDDNNNPGYSPDGGASLDFDYLLDLGIVPGNNLDPAITNLFYMNNVMHDIWYQYGFDEASGNFQENNYGNGGNGSDYVNAEAQDGGGMNNANFATPGDGSNPRMQMYLWSAPTSNNNLLEVNSPSSLAGPYTAVQAAFGPAVPTTPLTADFALVDDDSGDNEDACEALTNGPSLNGKIAIIRRGTCTFVSKVEAAEAEGAVAVIMVNNVGGAPITMGGNDPGIGIPSVMISQADGETIISELLSSTSINGTLQSSGNLVELDGDFDNGIIAHEYGHGISTRLTGGASNSNCLGNDEQMGEGWSDWFGLMLTIQPGDVPTDIRGIGTYAIGEPTTGYGIRPAPYTTDLNVNNYTYGDISNAGAISIPHGVGFVWCTMLWDLTWAFVNVYGYDADLYNGSGGNNMLMALVTEALKLQPCNPGFVDGRDAILQADQVLYNGDNQCLIWQVFAARGLGFSADQGSSNSRTDQTEAFDLPASCQLPTQPPVASFDFNANCTGEVSFNDLSTNNPNSWSWDFGDGNTSTLENPTHTYTASGSYSVELTSSNGIGSATETIIVTVSLPDAPTSSDENICANQTATFAGAGSGTLMWYDDSGTTLLESGNTFVTPSLSTTTSYLVQNEIQPVDYVGPLNGNFGSGNAHSQPSVFTLNFEAYTSFEIESVWVNANSTGNRTINVYSAVDGGGLVIDQVTVNITSTGPQRITLSLSVPSAGTYSIGGVNMDLFRNNGGVSYPYTLPNIVDIISSSAGPNYYYYYYDWEIHTSPCLSPFTQVTAFVSPSSSVTDVQSACGSYTWIDGNTYTSSNGNATYTLQNANGCDSIVTLDLTIYDSSYGTDVQSACDSYTWIDGNTYTSSNGNATYTLQNSNGCDSIVTLDLTIYNSSYGTDVQSACDSYTWIDGNTYTSSNNTATYMLTTAQGCDSLVTLDLTVNNVNSTIIQVDAGTAQAEAQNATYQWVDCANNYNAFSGETGQVFQCAADCYYEVAVLVTQNGCTDTSDCVVLNVLNLENAPVSEQIMLYPNPSSSKLYIEGLSSLNGIHSMGVLDYKGRLVKSLDELITTIEVDDLADGVYFLNIHHQDGIETKKFIVE